MPEARIPSNSVVRPWDTFLELSDDLYPNGDPSRPQQHGTFKGYLRGCDCDECQEAADRAPHGTISAYNQGCRCQFCRAANTERARNYRRSS